MDFDHDPISMFDLEKMGACFPRKATGVEAVYSLVVMGVLVGAFVVSIMLV